MTKIYVHFDLIQDSGGSGPSYTAAMEGFHDHTTRHQSEQHSDRVSDSVEDAISDEDVIAPTGLSLVCAASQQREKDDRMVDQDASASWDEVLEEADELAYVHKDNISVSYLSAGASKRHKSNSRLRFSIRGSSSGALNVKAGQSENVDQEVSSGMPPTKAPQTIMAELLDNINEETDHLPTEFSRPMEKENISVAELLEDLQDRSGASVGTSFSLRQHTGAMEEKPKVHIGKKILAPLLGQRNFYGDDPLDHVIGETSSDEEDVPENHLALVNKDVKEQTMTDLFQEAFNAANMEDNALPMRSTGVGYYGRMQQIIQMEKDRAEFLRQYNREQYDLGDSKGFTVEILSRSLEGKLTVCRCLFKENSNSPVTRKLSTDCDMHDNRIKRTIIFSPKICDNVDLVAGNIVHIYPPWKEVKVKDEEVIICTYFSHHGA